MYYTADHYKTFIPIKIEAYRKDKWGQTTFRKHSENVVCPLFMLAEHMKLI
jgi:hypothetical protein